MVGGWHRLLGQVVAVLSAQHSHCIYSCSELGPAAHLQTHVNAHSCASMHEGQSWLAQYGTILSVEGQSVVV
jgi:hypothetical protein